MTPTHLWRTFAYMTRKYFTTEEVAEMFHVPATTVRRWIRQGRLIAVDIASGSRSDYRIPEAEVIKFDEQRRTKATA